MQGIQPPALNSYQDYQTLSPYRNNSTPTVVIWSCHDRIMSTREINEYHHLPEKELQRWFQGRLKPVPRQLNWSRTPLSWDRPSTASHCIGAVRSPSKQGCPQVWQHFTPEISPKGIVSKQAASPVSIDCHMGAGSNEAWKSMCTSDRSQVANGWEDAFKQRQSLQ